MAASSVIARFVRPFTFGSALRNVIGLVIILAVLYIYYNIALYFFDAAPTAATYSFFFLMFMLMSVSHFISTDLLHQLEAADKKLREQNLRANKLHSVLLDNVATDLMGSIVIATLGTFAFCLSCHAWVKVFPEIFSTEADYAAINLYLTDIAAKGMLFDLIEHFEWDIAQLKHNRFDWFSCYTFAFRLYISLFAISAVARGWSLFKLVHQFPDYKPLIAKLARNLDDTA